MWVRAQWRARVSKPRRSASHQRGVPFTLQSAKGAEQRAWLGLLFLLFKCVYAWTAATESCRAPSGYALPLVSVAFELFSKWNDQIWRLEWRVFAPVVVRSHDEFSSPMPKECRRKSSKDFGFSVSGINEASRLERRVAAKSSQICDELIETAAQIAPSSGPPIVMDAPRVPQVTITPEGGGCSREMQQEDWDRAVDGTLRRKLSNSSISSTGSSAVESEDDLLSDNESKSKGIVTLEHLVEPGEVSKLQRDRNCKVATTVHFLLNSEK